MKSLIPEFAINPRASLPSWERGLKFEHLVCRNNQCIVAPLVGAWIEIRGVVYAEYNDYVAPLVGAWIEIEQQVTCFWEFSSLPSWERGLKFLSSIAIQTIALCRSPRGSVD